MLSTWYRELIISVSVAVIFSFKGKHTNSFVETICKRRDLFFYGTTYLSRMFFLLEVEAFFFFKAS